MMLFGKISRVVLCAAFGLACVCADGCKKKEAAVPEVVATVEAAPPTVASIASEVAADATLAPISQAAIAPRISAPIREEYVQRGSRVKRGQLLVVLENRDLQGAALDSQGALTTAQASYTAATGATIPEELKKAQLDVAQTKSARDLTQRTSEERARLFKEGALSGRDADIAKAAAVQAQVAYDLAQQHLDLVQKTTQLTGKETAVGQLTSARGKLASAEAQMSYASLRSPISGVVTERPLFPGETAASGTAVVTVMDTSSLLAKLHLAQSTAQQLGLGHAAQVHVPGIDQAVEATVSFISPALDPGSTTVEVWLKLPNADGKLKVGTAVHAVIAGAGVARALQVPVSALVPATDGTTAVMVVGPDGTVKRRPVTVGIRTAEQVQVVSGLAETEMVVTSGGYGLDDGTKVKVGKPGASEDAAGGAKD